MPNDRCPTPASEEDVFGSGPNGDADIMAYINKTPELLSMLYDIDMLPEQHMDKDREGKEWWAIFHITMHWRERELALCARSEKVAVCGVTSGSLVCELSAGHDGAHNGLGLIFGTPSSAGTAIMDALVKAREAFSDIREFTIGEKSAQGYLTEQQSYVRRINGCEHIAKAMLPLLNATLAGHRVVPSASTTITKDAARWRHHLDSIYRQAPWGCATTEEHKRGFVEKQNEAIDARIEYERQFDSSDRTVVPK